jgi:hypothetical protein
VAVNRKKLAGLVERAQRFRRVAWESCKGLSLEAVLARIEAATDPTDVDVATSVLGHVQAAHAAPWRNETTGELYLDDHGQEQPSPHAFDTWLYWLREGALHLPERLPRIFWESFNRRYCAVYHRCERCQAGFGNAVTVRTCPLCRGSIWYACVASSCWRPRSPVP